MIMTRLIMAAAAGLLAFVLTGCGEDNKQAEQTTTTTTTESTAPADTTKPAETTVEHQEKTVEQH